MPHYKMDGIALEILDRMTYVDKLGLLSLEQRKLRGEIRRGMNGQNLFSRIEISKPKGYRTNVRGRSFKGMSGECFILQREWMLSGICCQRWGRKQIQAQCFNNVKTRYMDKRKLIRLVKMGKQSA